MTSLSHTLFSPERLVIFEEISSTNEWIKSQLGQGLAHGTVVRAVYQSRGKGQMGSKWVVEPGKNLTFSFLLRPQNFLIQDAFFLSKWVGISLVSWLRKKVPSQSVQIKWPNDIWIGNKKAIGILIENQIEGQNLGSTIIGIGINVNQTNFGLELAKKATSLFAATGKEEDLDRVLWECLGELTHFYAFLLEKNWPYLDENYLQHLMGYKLLCNFEQSGRHLQAWIEGVERNGRLRLRQGQEFHTWDIKELIWKGIA